MNTIHFKFLKSLIVSAIILTGVSCVDPKPKNDDAGDDNGDDPQQVEAPAQIISVEQAKTMYDTYTERRVGLIQQNEQPNADGTPFNPTRYGWYDYDTLKQYMAYIEAEADKADVEISGVQLFFANYPDNVEFSDGSPIIYPRQNSFLIIPTMKVGNENVSFITAGDDENRSAVPVRSYLQDLRRSQGGGANQIKSGFGSQMMMMNFRMLQDQGQEEHYHSLILNEANLIPPPKQNTDLDH